MKTSGILAMLEEIRGWLYCVLVILIGMWSYGAHRPKRSGTFDWGEEEDVEGTIERLCEHCGEPGIHRCPHYGTHQPWMRDSYGEAICHLCRHYVSLHAGVCNSSEGCPTCNPDGLSIEEGLQRIIGEGR